MQADQVRQRGLDPAQVKQAHEYPKLKVRKELHTTSAYAAGGPVQDMSAVGKSTDEILEAAGSTERPRWVQYELPNGVTTTVSHQSSAQQQRGHAILMHMSDDKRQTFRDGNLRHLTGLAHLVRDNPQALAQGEYPESVLVARNNMTETFIDAFPTTEEFNEYITGPDAGFSWDSNSPAEDFLLAAVTDAQGAMGDWVSQLHQRKAAGERVKADLLDLQEQLDDWPEGETREVTFTEVTENADGTFSDVEVTRTYSREEAQELAARLEQSDELLTISSTDISILQFILQNWNQMVTAVSSSLKLSHDGKSTAINNLRAG